MQDSERRLNLFCRREKTKIYWKTLILIWCFYERLYREIVFQGSESRHLSVRVIRLSERRDCAEAALPCYPAGRDLKVVNEIQKLWTYEPEQEIVLLQWSGRNLRGKE